MNWVNRKRRSVAEHRAGGWLTGRFFDGLDLVPPGVIYVHTWRPEPGDIVPPDGVSAHGGVARKA